MVGQLKAIRAGPERRLLGNFKQPEPPMAAGSGLFEEARVIRTPTRRQGHRPQVSLGVPPPPPKMGTWVPGGGGGVTIEKFIGGSFSVPK